MMLELVVFGALAAVGCYGGVAAMRRIAEARGLVDVPNQRSLHQRPTPRLGGVAMVVVVLAGGSLWTATAGLSGDLAFWTALTAAALPVIGVSLLEDVRHVPWLARLCVHLVSASALILLVGRWETVMIPFRGAVALGPFSYALTLLWIVGLLNAYNFMDGIDGLAGVQGVAAGCGWAFAGATCGQPFFAVIGALIAGASVGFLGHNWAPAKIFMGDVGSTFLGLCFAALPVMAFGSTPQMAIAGPLFVWPFIVDPATTLVRRLARGEPITQPHRSHLYQRLVLSGLSHPQVSALYGSLAGAGVIVGIGVVHGSNEAMLASLIVVACLATGLLLMVRYQERLGWQGHPVATKSLLSPDSPYLRHLSGFHLRNRHFLALDAALLLITPLLALILRTDTEASSPVWQRGLAVYTIFALGVRLPIFFQFGLYRRYWKYASVGELLSIAAAVGLATLIIAIVFIGLQPLWQIPGVRLPRSVPLIDGVLALLVVGGTRFAVRLANLPPRLTRRSGGKSARRVLIVGAEDAGNMVVRELRSGSRGEYVPVGFIDDEASKRGISIQGVPVLGSRMDLPRLVSEHGIEEVIIAMPEAPGWILRDIIRLCEAAGVRSKTVPGVFEILSGRLTVSEIREVQIEDLLRRSPVTADSTEPRAAVSGRCVLVTGAGGSIGSELCRQLVRLSPARLILLGHGENSLYVAHRELLACQASAPIDVVVADVRDPERIARVFGRFSPQVVFHAAAHKHVPLLEDNPEEAVTNNVGGTRVVVAEAMRAGVERFVLISTDKAVNPVSVMGVTKRIAELIVHEAASAMHRPFVSVRFGNVLGSRGSVVPLFRQQIAAGGPVTITHSEATRYFMTIPEAVHLVLQAMALGDGAGGIFVLDMGEPMRILDLATDLIELSGLRPGIDIEIKFTGLRPGEKLKEELFYASERPSPTRHPKILRADHGSAGAGRDFNEDLDSLLRAAAEGRREETLELFQRFVPSAGRASIPQPAR